MLKKYIAEKKRIQSESENKNNIISDRDNSFHQDLSHDEPVSDFETPIVNTEQKHNRPVKPR
jgi:hypothetical protein